MALFTETRVRERENRATTLQKSVASVLNEHIQKQASVGAHDIFLSHAYEDKELVLGVALLIEDLGFSVYLDWRDDPTLDRKNVNAATAERLRARLKASKSLFYSTTEHAGESKWMPWELGFKDAHNTRVAILPVARTSANGYQGQQYLSLYPYADRGPDTAQKERLWIRKSPTCYVVFEAWLEGRDPYERE